MSYIFFEDVLTELGHKQTYDAVVNYAGNSFVEKSWDMIKESNPMALNENQKSNTAMNNLAGFFNSAAATIKIGKPKIDGRGAKENGKEKD